jgi:CO/xanthine dehydrogenase Mo-binding subunit
MKAPIAMTGASRRALLQSLGALIVFAPAGSALAQAAGSARKLDPAQLDTWVAIGRDGQVSAFFGKIDVGQGVDVAIAQIVAEELDVPTARVSIIAGDTDLTCNQGGVSGSTGIQRGAVALRNAAAEARRILVERAAGRLGVSLEGLTVTDGVVSAGAGKSVSYAELVGGQSFDAPLQWNGQYGNGLVASGKAKPKSPDQYRQVGKDVERRDVPHKVLGTAEYVTDHRLKGMLHARTIRPPVAGAAPVSVDLASIAAIPGAKVVRKGDFIAVVAAKEWDAVRAARALKVGWSNAEPPFPGDQALYDHIRNAPVARREMGPDKGTPDAAFAGAKVIEAEYEWPFQSHASLAPACAVADVRADRATVWTGSQKPHAARDGVAGILGLPVERVRAIALPGPGSYGRNDAGDAAVDAALISKEVGRPVRLQYMRNEGTGWDPKGPASVHRARAVLGPDGKISAYEFISKAFSRFEAGFSEANANDSLAGMLTGLEVKTQYGFGGPEDAYAIPNRRTGSEMIAPLLAKASPLRTSHLRDPTGPQVHFASESFIDELAHAAGQDPVAFRLAHLTAPRDVAVIKAAAEKAGWTARPSGPRDKGPKASGRGIAYAGRGGTFVAVVAEVEVDRSSGRVWARRLTVAHDCGLIINPLGLRHCVEGNVMQGLSRTLLEEVRFDRANVTSVDWATYPILDITDAPESVEIVLIDRPEIAPSGAGEPTIRLIAPAVANAVFDATGVRIRRAPLSPERVKAALA